MNIENTKNFINQLSEPIPKEDIYKLCIPSLKKDNFFSVLNDNDYISFHKKLISIAGMEHGLGIGVSLMAQINIAGQVLRISSEAAGNKTASNLLINIIQGNATVSLGVSEPGWHGKIKNIQSKLTKTDDRYLLSGSKSFFTNGGNSSHFIVIAKSSEDDYKTIILTKDTAGLELENFSLDFAGEATHCRAKLNNIIVLEENILPINYQKHAEHLRFSEILSLSALFAGYGKYLLSTLAIETNPKDALLDELFELDQLFDFYIARILEISKIKMDGNYKLTDFYPYGIETMISKFYKSTANIRSKEEWEIKYPDIKLFNIQDFYMSMLVKKAKQKFKTIEKLTTDG
jgi:hypothetical protein